jgi:hypothetical protein
VIEPETGRELKHRKSIDKREIFIALSLCGHIRVAIANLSKQMCMNANGNSTVNVTIVFCETDPEMAVTVRA